MVSICKGSLDAESFLNAISLTDARALCTEADVIGVSLAGLSAKCGQGAISIRMNFILWLPSFFVLGQNPLLFLQRFL